MRKYLIWSFEHSMWWGKNHAGYTLELANAGRYTAEEAVEILCNSVQMEEIPVREHEADNNKWPATTRNR
jgi:hypothetical protein